MAHHISLIAVFLVGALLVPQIAALKGCTQACNNDDDCSGRLACMNGKCNDDPGVGTHICANAPPAPQGANTCNPTGHIDGVTPSQCDTGHMSDCCKTGETYGKYYCSPPITAPATKATLTLNGFGQGQDGGGAPACTPNRWYSASEAVVAMSTGWFENYKRCGTTIRIHGNGRSTVATVVDECDSRAGCDAAHAFQPPCAIDIVDASQAVWGALGVFDGDGRYGFMAVTWSQIA